MLPGRFETVGATVKSNGAWIFCILAFVIGAVVTPFVAASIVAIVGFGPKGVEKGTWAAEMQASIGSIEKDSPFALAQKIGMGGGVPLYGIVAGGIILVALAMPFYFSVRLMARLIARWIQVAKNKRMARMEERKKNDEEMQNLKVGYFYAI